MEGYGAVMLVALSLAAVWLAGKTLQVVLPGVTTAAGLGFGICVVGAGLVYGQGHPVAFAFGAANAAGNLGTLLAIRQRVNAGDEELPRMLVKSNLSTILLGAWFVVYGLTLRLS
ncbi:MAG: hypothetical protein K9L28_09455 [Synergistales bacterium]|nr:hypothetical protein [Synergistales bacterium]